MAQRFLSIDDLAEMPAPKWLIHGMFEVGSLVMLAGPSGSFKSFLALDWALCMASKRQWHGKATTPSKVLYVLGEGKSNLLKRVLAWSHHNKTTQQERADIVENFRVTFEVPQLASKLSTDQMLAALKAEKFEPSVIVIDTFARSFVGMDENSQKDTGLWIEQADRLRQMGYTVLFLHHTAKNAEFGLKYRGSTVIMGAMDTAYTFFRDYKKPSLCTLTCSKQKDHDEGEPMYLERLVMPLAGSEEGSMVLVEAEPPDDDGIDELLKDDSFETDSARAKELAKVLKITDGAAKTKISRRRAEN